MVVLLPVTSEALLKSARLLLEHQHPGGVAEEVAPSPDANFVVHHPLKKRLRPCADPLAAVGHLEHSPIVGLNDSLRAVGGAREDVQVAGVGFKPVEAGHAGPVHLQALDPEDLPGRGPRVARVPPCPLAVQMGPAVPLVAIVAVATVGHARLAAGARAADSAHPITVGLAGVRALSPEPAVAALELERPHDPQAVVWDEYVHSQPALCPKPADPHWYLCKTQRPTNVITDAVLREEVLWQLDPGCRLHIHAPDRLHAQEPAHALPGRHTPDSHGFVVALLVNGIGDGSHTHETQGVGIQRAFDRP
mmetsp:Transcript_82244/g.228246  ORF Transcript_82244/g.228246 Transcript_82244/m.228246 type:complete len:306 (-) Transcript_82244:2806-3723(-)